MNVQFTNKHLVFSPQNMPQGELNFPLQKRDDGIK